MKIQFPTLAGLHPLAALIGLAMLSGCATGASLSSDEELDATLASPMLGEKVDRICFSRGIDRFSNEKRNSVVLRRSVNDEYLVVSNFCPDLDRAMSLRLDSRSGCLRRDDFIRVYQSAFGPREGDPLVFERCRIDAIYKWNEDDRGVDDALSEDLDEGES